MTADWSNISTTRFRRSSEPEDIAIEVLESVLFDGVDPALNTIAQLQKRGYKIELDDFGTGHASISNLEQFKVDGIKLDKDFVAGVDQDAEQEVILRTMIDLCHNLDIVCLAEGVETEAEKNKLISLGCSRSGLWRGPPDAARCGPERGNMAATPLPRRADCVDILHQAQCVIDRRVGVTRRHRIADPKQLKRHRVAADRL